MGIRFHCPNGHKLNVKEHLAGMRAICPECDVRFLVPLESGDTVEALIDAAEPSESPDPAPSGDLNLPTEPEVPSRPILPEQAEIAVDNFAPQESEIVENHRRLQHERRQRTRMIAIALTGLICLMAVVLAIILSR